MKQKNVAFDRHAYIYDRQSEHTSIIDQYKKRVAFT